MFDTESKLLGRTNFIEKSVRIAESVVKLFGGKNGHNRL